MDNFTEPLMEDALARRKLELSRGAEAKNDDDNGNLLEYLVKHTEGMRFSLSPSFLFAYFILLDDLDKNILKDEVI